MDWMTEATAPVYEVLCSKGREKLAHMYRECFRSTWDTTLQRSEGTVFLITGDIPAMWLRDSSAQVYHYLPYAKDRPEVTEVIRGLLKRQFQYIILDNAVTNSHLVTKSFGLKLLFGILIHIIHS